jgi:hypothetical protein
MRLFAFISIGTAAGLFAALAREEYALARIAAYALLGASGALIGALIAHADALRTNMPPHAPPFSVSATCALIAALALIASFASGR